MGITFDFSKKKEIALYKRIAEYVSMVPGFSEEFNADRAATLDKYGISDVDPVYKEAYEAYIKGKLEWRDGHKNSCAPDNNRMKKWRERQKNRCILSFPDGAAGNVQIPIMYELSSGCSVGCEFCGVGAKGLKSIFKYTEENAKLFTDILNIGKSVIGEASQHAALYFATEPLDNPDYEKYRDIFIDVLGQTPQLTTAVAVRDIERTRALVSKLNEKSNMFYRFSVRSLEDFYKIMENFTAEELLFVELIPQYKEAPGNMFVKAGKNRDSQGLESSISCVTGFLINMCEMTVKLTTPVVASEKYPEGMVILLEEKFSTADELEDIMKKGIAEKMKTILEPDEQLLIYPWIEYQNTEEKTGLRSKNGVEITIDHNEYEHVYSNIYDALKAGIYTRREIGEIVSKKTGMATPVGIYSLINKLWNMGLIYDESLYGLRKE